MNAERSRPPEIGYSSLQELAGDATQSHNTGVGTQFCIEAPFVLKHESITCHKNLYFGAILGFIFAS